MSRFEMLDEQLARLRAQYVRSRAWLFALCVLTAIEGLLLSFVLGDLAVHFPQYMCWVHWVVAWACVFAGIHMVAKVARQHISPAAMARLVEKAVPHSRNHYVNAIQISDRLDHSEPFVEELLRETDFDLDRVTWRHLYSQKPRRYAKRALAGMTSVLLIVFIISPQAAVRATLRFAAPMAGLAPFTLTKILSVAPGNTAVARGMNVEVTTRFDGAFPANARIVWDDSAEGASEVPLEALLEEDSPGPGTRWAARLPNVCSDLKYQIRAGDAKSPWYSVVVSHPPELDSWEATVVPPKYTGLDTRSFDSSNKAIEAPLGATVKLTGKATTDLSEVSVLQRKKPLARAAVDRGKTFEIDFGVPNAGQAEISLKSTSELQSTLRLPMAVLMDQNPRVILVETEQRLVAEPDSSVTLTFRAEDDYGVIRGGLERILPEGQREDVTIADAEEVGRHFQARFVAELPTFDARPGDTLRFRIWAEDNGPHAEKRRGYSPVIHVSIPGAEERRASREKAIADSSASLKELIKLQRANLNKTRELADFATMGRKIEAAPIQDAQNTQVSIRRMAAELVDAKAPLGDLLSVLANLVEHEMAEAVVKFDEVRQAVEAERGTKLRVCVEVETRIIAALTNMDANIVNEEKHQNRVDLLTAIQKLVAGQRDNLKATKENQNLSGEQRKTVALALAKQEDKLAQALLVFLDLCTAAIDESTEDDFAAQARQVYDLLRKEDVYEKMLAAAEALEFDDFPAGIQSEEEALKSLMQALNILNTWRMKHAKKVIQEANEVVKEVTEALKEMEAKQATIAEVTRDLTKRGELDDESREKLAEMDEEQKEMAALIEKLAQDLYQFPELPVCNELNSKMREIYEDVEQALDSENAEAVEIAVQKEDSLLDAIRNTKERAEDVEMWLPDTPDNIVWNMESFDADEFPEIPLVPLPDELEDLVGELLDQAESIAQQSEDTTGNNIIADATMGWDVADGPMPSFAAKGKSGNTRPNDNEMTGRSGAGREGQSNGELVENHVKGLEGTETHARRTQDPFQKGMVTEDEDSTMDARATGGGKLGGESETNGMFGKAPRRDLHTAEHGTNPTQLRREAEALYATARLLYLGSGGLGTATRDLRGMEDSVRDMKGFDSLSRKVMRRLADTQVEIESGVVLPMPTATVSRTGGAAFEDIDLDNISDEYRALVSEYFRSLGTR